MARVIAVVIACFFLFLLFFSGHHHADVEALGASVATLVTDACQVLVEQAAATGVEAALAKGRSADHKSALAKAEKVQGNTQAHGQLPYCGVW